MKHFFIPMTLAVVLILTSLSACNPLNPIYCPLRAEINGEMYTDEYAFLDEGNPIGHTETFHGYYTVSTGARYLQSSAGDTLVLTMRLDEKKKDASCFSLNTRYKLFAVLRDGWNVYESAEDAWISFDVFTTGHIEGEFEFVVRDESTGEVLYDVKKGYFQLPLYK